MLLMQLETAKILRDGRIRRTPEERCESLDVPDSRCASFSTKWAGTKGNGPIKHALDSEPHKRVTGCWLAYGNMLPSMPEVGAVCGKAARTVLCRGAR